MYVPKVVGQQKTIQERPPKTVYSVAVAPHLTAFAGDDAIMHSGRLIATDLARDNFDLC